jgi:GNAT superfamily N-acetyltransferase
MQVRIARGTDATAVERIRVDAWRVAYRKLLPPDELDAMAVDPTRWLVRFETPPTGWTGLVAERDGQVIGFAVVGPSRDESEVGELYAIYVAPAAWSTGAGRALIEGAERQLATEYDVATLWVLKGNDRACRFYERSGWSPDGATKTEERWGVPSPELRYRKQLQARE